MSDGEFIKPLTRDNRLRMVKCPVPGCGAEYGKDYEEFAWHLAMNHGPEDLGLSPIGEVGEKRGGAL